MVYIVIRHGLENTIIRVFSNIDSAKNYADDKNDIHQELYARRKKSDKKLNFPGDIYSVYQYKIYERE